MRNHVALCVGCLVAFAPIPASAQTAAWSRFVFGEIANGADATTNVYAIEPVDGILGKWVVKDISESNGTRDARFPYRVDFKLSEPEERSWVHVDIDAFGDQHCNFELRGQNLIGQENLINDGAHPIGLCTTTMNGGSAADRCRDPKCSDAVRQDDAFLEQLFLTGGDLKWHRIGTDLVIDSSDGRKSVLLTRWQSRKPPVPNRAAISERFAELSANVQAWRNRLSADALEDMDDLSARITDCDLPFEEDDANIIEIDHATYRYITPRTGEDTFCTYLLEPERRALSADEARILFQALQTPSAKECKGVQRGQVHFFPTPAPKNEPDPLFQTPFFTLFHALQPFGRQLVEPCERDPERKADDRGDHEPASAPIREAERGSELRDALRKRPHACGV